jgi:hypothetical protein
MIFHERQDHYFFSKTRKKIVKITKYFYICIAFGKNANASLAQLVRATDC